MKKGNKVKFLHRNEEGKIARVIDDKWVEVEIEDGFPITAQKDELILVNEVNSKSEKDYSEEQLSEEYLKNRDSDNSPLPLEENIFISCYFSTENELCFHLINNLPYQLLFTANEEYKNYFRYINSGHIKPFSVNSLTRQLYKMGDELPPFHFQILFFEEDVYTPKDPIDKRLKIKSKYLLNDQKHIPTLDVKGFIFPLIKSDDKQYTERYFNDHFAYTGDYNIKNRLEHIQPPEVVDLHMEELTEEPEKFNSEAILEFQLFHFHNTLEKALASGMKEITFIHGVGNGVLKDAIHKSLSKNSYIKTFKDAQREKFGFGATFIQLK